jgi:FkbM family methyltransferase
MSTRSPVGAVRTRAAAAIAALRGQDRPLAAPEPLQLHPSAAIEAAARRDVEDFENMRRLLAFSLAPDANCIDVGAHRGAVLAEMQRVAPHGRHIAFEPLPHLCQPLRTMFPAVEVHEAALSNHAGTADFAYVHGVSEGWSGLLFRPLPPGAEAEVEQITVRLEVLDEILDPDYPPAVIKIDVEGAEQQVFEGALGTLRRHRPIVIFEHGTGSAETYGTSPADIHALLGEEAGLRIFDLDGSGPYTLEEFERVFYAGERVNFVARV